MERLPGVDAGFLHMETPTAHMHTLKIGILDISGLPPQDVFGLLKAELARRLHLLPPFRRRIVPIPLNLHHPVWIEDPDFDLEAHVHRAVLPAPGTREQLDDLIGDIAGTPLDRTRPLWELWVVEGLEDGQIAAVTKIHHTLADGAAAAALLAEAMAATPEADVAPPDEPWRPEPLPARSDLLRGALREWRDLFRALPGLLRATWQRLQMLRRVKAGFAVPAPRPVLDAPRASFNGALSADRVFATASLPFDDFRRVRRAFEVDFNDVVLAVVAGAMCRWLEIHGEQLDKPMLASVPVSTDKDPRLFGNRLSTLLPSLCTDVSDPVERLRRIHQGTRQAKKVQEALGLDMLESWVEYTPPGPFSALMRAYSKLHVADHHPPPVNAVISNVPGPREPLYASGAKLTGLFSVGPILEGIGLNITVWSYTGDMNFAALSCRRAMPDLRVLVDGLAPSLAELVAAADQLEQRGEAARPAS